MSLFKYFKRVDISALLPDPKGSLSDHLPTAPIAEANKKVLKAVAEANEPQKKGPYIKSLQNAKHKLPSLLLLMEIASLPGNTLNF